ncbi:MAG: addiction module antidote protein, HigA family, partial [Alphaproteobacteria bacterium]|nr:addiction module antidote protein, HigA family [Alphaproteobacteria bacterium]
LSRAFGNTPEFWLNVQRRTELWDALNTPDRRKRIERARAIKRAA